MRKRGFCMLFLAVVACLSCLGAAVFGAENPILSKDNWVNLPGYQYVGNVKGDPKPAQVYFPSTFGTESKGINYVSGGYDKRVANGQSGYAFTEKIDVSDFSLTFTVNQVAAVDGQGNSDGWIGFVLAARPEKLDYADATYNSGMMFLIRTGSNYLQATLDESAVNPENPSESICNFGDYPAQSYALLNVAGGRVEGATFRIGLKKDNEGKYFATLSQIEYTNGGDPADAVACPVKNSVTFNLPLYHPDWYFAEDKANLVITASTNTTTEWDLSVKEINGTLLGTAPDISPLTPTDQALAIIDTLTSLRIAEYLEPAADYRAAFSDGKKTEALAFYADNSEFQTKAVVDPLYNLLHTLSAETLDALCGNDADVFNNPAFDFGSTDAARKANYLAYLKDCCRLAMRFEADAFEAGLETFETLLASGANPVDDENAAGVNRDFKLIQLTYRVLSQPTLDGMGEDGQAAVRDLFQRVGDALSRYYVGTFNAYAEECVALFADGEGEADLDLTKTREYLGDYILYLNNLDYYYENIFESQRGDCADTAVAFLGKMKAAYDALYADDGLSDSMKNYMDGVNSVVSMKRQISELPDPVTALQKENIEKLVSDYLLLSSELKGMMPDEAERLLAAGAEMFDDALKVIPRYATIQKNLQDPTKDYVANGTKALLGQLSLIYGNLETMELQLGVTVLDALDAAQFANYEMALLKVRSLDAPTEVKAYSHIASVVEGDTVTVYLSDLFVNLSGVTLTYRTSAGAIKDNSLEIENIAKGETVVTVTATDVFGQEFANTFTLTAAEKAPEKTGCGSVAGDWGGILPLALALLVLFSAALLSREGNR